MGVSKHEGPEQTLNLGQSPHWGSHGKLVSHKQPQSSSSILLYEWAKVHTFFMSRIWVSYRPLPVSLFFKLLPSEQWFLSSCPPKKIIPWKLHRAVSSRRSFIKQNESTLPEGREQAVWKPEASPAMRVGFAFRVVESPSLCLNHLIGKVINSFRLHNFLPCMQALIHKHPSKVHKLGGGAKTTMLIYHKHGIINPRLLWATS